MAKINLKKVLGGIAAAGMALGGLVLAGKSEFGKNLGAPAENEDPLKLEPLGGEPEPVEAETEPEPEENPAPEAEE